MSFLSKPRETIDGRCNDLARTDICHPFSAPFEARGPSFGSRPVQAGSAATRAFGDLELAFDAEAGAYWCFLRGNAQPCFTQPLLEDMLAAQEELHALSERQQTEEAPLRYFILGSRIRNIFNLGGDLAFFVERIRAGDHAGLRAYAHACTEIVHAAYSSFGLPLVTVALVQGDALGGGFEAALACNLIVAERGAKFGLPEILFNLFPGMGAYSFLSRRLDPVRAERMILSGRIYSAAEMHEMGLVDVLAEDGAGEQALRDYILANRRRHNTHRALYETRRRVNPVTLQELKDVTDLWVEAAMRLTATDLRRMERITLAQHQQRLERSPWGMAAE